MKIKATIMDQAAIDRALTRMAYEIAEHNKTLDGIAVIGILRRGASIAELLTKKLQAISDNKIPSGALDISPFRDDREINTDCSTISFTVTNKTIILVDDVLHTGRSARAGIDALFSRGRPNSIQLACLIDRGHRELPIRPDYIGKNVPTSSLEQVKVNVKEYDDEYSVIILSNKEV